MSFAASLGSFIYLFFFLHTCNPGICNPLVFPNGSAMHCPIFPFLVALVGFCVGLGRRIGLHGSSVFGGTTRGFAKPGVCQQQAGPHTIVMASPSTGCGVAGVLMSAHLWQVMDQSQCKKEIQAITNKYILSRKSIFKTLMSTSKLAAYFKRGCICLRAKVR